MKTITIWAFGLSTFILFAMFAMAWWSNAIFNEEPQFNGVLAECTVEKSCVCSEVYASAYPRNRISPLKVESPDAWQAAIKSIEAMGGKIRKQRSDYLWAEFRTPLFKFVDDVELRFDRDAKIIHLRSESRIGLADMYTNRKRIDHIKAVIQDEIAQGGQTESS